MFSETKSRENIEFRGKNKTNYFRGEQDIKCCVLYSGRNKNLKIFIQQLYFG